MKSVGASGRLLLFVLHYSSFCLLCVVCLHVSLWLIGAASPPRSIYYLHEEVKDKPFELELTWVCDESGRKHTLVPEELRQEAIKYAVEEKKKVMPAVVS